MTISGVTIANNSAAEGGGGVVNAGNMTINGGIIANNAADVRRALGTRPTRASRCAALSAAGVRGSTAAA